MSRLAKYNFAYHISTWLEDRMEHLLVSCELKRPEPDMELVNPHQRGTQELGTAVLPSAERS
jgi:hypothetical protein